MCGLTGSDTTAGVLLKDTRNPPSAASVWDSDLKQELASWYWHDIIPNSYGCKMDEHWRIASALQSMGLSAKSAEQGGDNKCYRIERSMSRMRLWCC